MRFVSRFSPANRRTAAGFLDQESGSVTIFAIFGFAMCMVIIGLVFDVGRVMSIHSQVNSYADRVALAAAEELDGRPGALNRARIAADTSTSLIGEGQRLSLSGDSTIGVRRLTFLARLAADPADPATRSPVPGDVVTATWNEGDSTPSIAGGYTLASAEAETRFVLVDTTREREGYILLPLMAWLAPGADTDVTVAPQAIAGFDRRVCNSAPLMLCNPAEAGAVNALFTYDRFKQIRATIRTDGGVLRPGDLKVLSTPTGTGSAALRRYMGMIEPNTSCYGPTVDIRSGTNLGAIREGINTRFDMFNGALIGERNDADYTPARATPKGFSTAPGNCAVSKNTARPPLPRDNCFMPTAAWPAGAGAAGGTGCTNYLGNKLSGDGQWDRASYWTANHNGQPQPAGYASMSRYDVYRAETAANLAPPAGNTCSSSPAATSRPNDPLRDRRVLPVAIVNCLSTQTSGNRNAVPVEAWAEVFLTEPVNTGVAAETWWGAAGSDVYLEIVGYTRPTLPSTVQREYPVLFR